MLLAMQVRRQAEKFISKYYMGLMLVSILTAITDGLGELFLGKYNIWIILIRWQKVVPYGPNGLK